MSSSKVTRRRFLKGLAAAAGGTVLAACAPQVVKETVIVEKPVKEVVKETVIVEKAVSERVVETVVVEQEVSVEKRVVETVVVEKEKVITAVPEAMVAPIELTLASLKGMGWPEMNDEIMSVFTEKTGGKYGVRIFWITTWPLRDKYVPLIAAGTPPDVVHDMPGAAAPLYLDGSFLPIDDLIDTAPWSREDIVQADMDCLNFTGKQLMTPLWHNGCMGHYLTYRKDFCDEAGVAHPAKNGAFESYADVMAFAQKLQQSDASGNVTRWGYQTENGCWVGMRVLGGVIDQGGHWWDEANQQFTLTSDEVIQSLQTIMYDPIFTHGVAWPHELQPEGEYTTWMFDGLIGCEPNTSMPMQSAKTQDRTDMLEVLGWAEMPGMAKGEHNMAWEGTWGCGIMETIDPDRIQAAFELCTAPLDLRVARVILDKCGPGSALKAFKDDPFVAELAAKGPADQCLVETYLWEMTNPIHWVGWEWGEPQMYDFPCRRCWGMFDDQGRCDDTGPAWAGKMTAEQLAEEWQKEAGRMHDKFWEQA